MQVSGDAAEAPATLRPMAVPSATRILTVRHGESEWNALGRWQGQADPPLTENGLVQAYTAAQSLGSFDAIWASTLQRAAHTAAVIAEVLGVGPVQLHPGLMESDLGPWQGLSTTEIEAGWPNFLAESRRPDGAETVEQLTDRGLAALRHIAAATPGGEVLAVTHAGLVRALAAAAGKPGLRLTNLGACWFTVHGDGRVSVSDPVHLIDSSDGTGSL